MPATVNLKKLKKKKKAQNRNPNGPPGSGCRSRSRFRSRSATSSPEEGRRRARPEEEAALSCPAAHPPPRLRAGGGGGSAVAPGRAPGHVPAAAPTRQRRRRRQRRGARAHAAAGDLARRAPPGNLCAVGELARRWGPHAPSRVQRRRSQCAAPPSHRPALHHRHRAAQPNAEGPPCAAEGRRGEEAGEERGGRHVWGGRVRGWRGEGREARLVGAPLWARGWVRGRGRELSEKP